MKHFLIVPVTALALGACASVGAPDRPALIGAAVEIEDTEVCAPGGVRPADTAAERATTPSSVREMLGLAERKPSAFDRFQRPVTSLQFHHPFIRNELRPLFMYHKFPETSAVGGGNLQAYALQVFLAITEDIQFMAYKDGYVDFNPDALPDETGYADIAIGLKAKVYENEERLETAAVGLGYETKTGSDDVLEGQGSGIFDIFGSGAKAFGPVNVIGTVGLLLPSDNSRSTRTLHFHAHADMEVMKGFFPLVEVNGHEYLDDAHRDARLGVPLNFEGGDYTNLGSSNVDGNTVITGAVGFRYELAEDVSFGAAYEVPLTNRDDLFARRFTFDVTLRF